MNVAFASDNTAPAAPEVVAAIATANHGAAPSYGEDDWTARLGDALTAAFAAPQPVGVVPILSGKLANQLSLAAITRPGGIVFCHELAHILADENGGPEYVTRCRLIGLPGDGGKIAPETLRAAIAAEGAIPPHSALSLTNATEAGTVYALADLRALTAVAREHGLRVHLDGARIANAVAALGCEPAEATWRSGIDVLSLGATKNGGLSAEAVVLFDPTLAERLTEVQWLLGHAPSKMRFLSAQLLAWLEHDGWRTRAAHANATAQRLAADLCAIPGVALVFPVQANLLFVDLPDDRRARLAAAGYFTFPMPMFGPRVTRLATNWATTDEEVDGLLSAIGG